jgi:hypothetical protein
VITLMTAGGCATGAAVFGVIFWRCRASLRRSKLVAGDLLAEHYRKQAERLERLR